MKYETCFKKINLAWFQIDYTKHKKLLTHIKNKSTKFTQIIHVCNNLNNREKREIKRYYLKMMMGVGGCRDVVVDEAIVAYGARRGDVDDSREEGR